MRPSLAGLLVAAVCLPTVAFASPATAHGPVAAAAPEQRASHTPLARPAQWCGAEQTQDDRANAVDNGRFRYHAIYLTPSDVPSRFGELAGEMQASAFEASSLLERLYGRALRFDLGTRCGATHLDISSVRVRQTAAEFAAAATTPNGTLRLVSRVLAGRGFPTLKPAAGRKAASRLTTNYVVWLDAPAPAHSCGVADVYDDPTRSTSNWNNFGGKVAVVFRNEKGFCGASAVRHEIGHTLGALGSSAPNSFDGTHCDDAYEDTMCYPHAPVRAGGDSGTEYFDYGNDDYWDPPNGKPLRWWTANLNRFVCPDVACTRVSAAKKVRA